MYYYKSATKTITCPNCGKTMEIVFKSLAATKTCSCGYYYWYGISAEGDLDVGCEGWRDEWGNMQNKDRTIEEMVNALKDYTEDISINYYSDGNVWQIKDERGIDDSKKLFNGNCVQSDDFKIVVKKAYLCLHNQRDFDAEDEEERQKSIAKTDKLQK